MNVMDMPAVETYTSIDELRDGLRTHILMITRQDKNLFLEFWQHPSKQSQYFRLFIYKDELTDKDLEFFTNTDRFHHVGLLASVLEEKAKIPVAVGRYVQCD